jgi:hypothetical protein
VVSDATLTVGGQAVTVSTRSPGQQVKVTFAGQAGQRVILKWSAMTFDTGFIRIVAPDERTLVLGDYGIQANNPHQSGVLTLPVAGTYTLFVAPSAGELRPTGSITLQVQSAG